MRLRITPEGLIVEDRPRGRWVSLSAALESASSDDEALTAACDGVLGFLRGGADVREAASELLDTVSDDAGVAADPAHAGLPFQPRSMRAFMLNDGAMIECCSELAQMPPVGDYQSRKWPIDPTTINQWGGPPPPRFLMAGHPVVTPVPGRPSWANAPDRTPTAA